MTNAQTPLSSYLVRFSELYNVLGCTFHPQLYFTEQNEISY